MVSLNILNKPRRHVRGRDFSQISYRAPTTIKRLSQAYNEKPATWWQRWKMRVIILGTIILTAAFVYSPLFQIKNVIINNMPSREAELQVQTVISNLMNTRQMYILPQRNLLFFNTNEAGLAIAKEFYGEGLVFEKSFPNILRVNMPADVVVATWQTGEKDYLLDKRGILVQEITADQKIDPNLFVIREPKPLEHKLGDVVAPEKIIEFISNVNLAWQAQLPEKKFDYVQFDENSLPSIQIFMPNGWYVYISAQQDPKPQIEALKVMLEQKIKDDEAKLDYVDVRFGPKYTFKLK